MDFNVLSRSRRAGGAREVRRRLLTLKMARGNTGTHRMSRFYNNVAILQSQALGYSIAVAKVPVPKNCANRIRAESISLFATDAARYRHRAWDCGADI